MPRKQRTAVEAIDGLAAQIEALRRGDPVAPLHANPAVALEDRIADAEGRGDVQALLQLQAQQVAEQMLEAGARDGTITLTRTDEHGNRVDIKDDIASLEADAAEAQAEGDVTRAEELRGEAHALKIRLGAEQLGHQYHEESQVLLNGFAALGLADQEFLPGGGNGGGDGGQGGGQAPPPTPPEQLYPGDVLSQLLNGPMRSTLTVAQVEEFRGMILAKHTADRPAAARARMEQADAAIRGRGKDAAADKADVHALTEAGGELMVAQMVDAGLLAGVGAGEGAGGAQPASQPPQAQVPDVWSVERMA